MALTIDERFIPINLLNEYFVDKETALPLSNGSIEFFRDVSRATLKSIFQISSTGGDYVYTALPNPITLSSVGTAENTSGQNVAIYLFPFLEDPQTNKLEPDLYFIVCKDQFGAVQWTREAIPNLGDANNPNIDEDNTTNRLSNPQFSRYFIGSDETISNVSAANPTVYPIAPDWDLLINGSGNVIIKRVPVTGSLNLPTSPSFLLEIETQVGITFCRLRQRLSKNSGLWSEKAVSGFFGAKLVTGNANTISMLYRDSSGLLSNISLFTAQIDTTFNVYSAGQVLPNSSNGDSGDDAFVDIELDLPLESTIQITSIQITVSENDKAIGTVGYDIQSANRDQALMGDWYIPRLEEKEIPSILIGWDFSLNPRQFLIQAIISPGTAGYAWDQTIVQASTLNNVEIGEEGSTGGIFLQNIDTDGGFAMLQYLEREDAQKINQSRLSVNINAFSQDAVNESGKTRLTVRLFANSTPNPIIFEILPTTIFSIGGNGVVTLTANAVANGWYEINRSNLPRASVTIKRIEEAGFESLTTGDHDYGFNGWAIDDATQAEEGVEGFAIVVEMLPEPGKVNYKTVINSVSLVPGDIPTRPAHVTFEATLLMCERFFEKSYPNEDEPGDITGEDDPSAILRELYINPYPGNTPGVPVARPVFARIIDIPYRVEKRTNPINTYFSPDTGDIGKIMVFTSNGVTIDAKFEQPVLDINQWSVENVSEVKTQLLPKDNSLAIFSPFSALRTFAFARFHYVADARIGFA